MSPPWYEVLLIGQRQVNTELTALCEQQQKLIESLERRLSRTSDIGDYLSTSSSAADDEPRITVGPASFPIQWTGSPSDCIPVSVNGERLKATILTRDMTEQWNKILDIQPRTEAYEAVVKRTMENINRCHDYIEEGDFEAARRGGENHNKQSYEDEIKDLDTRLGQVRLKLEECYDNMKVPREKLYCEMHRILRSQGTLTHHKDGWRQKLFDTELWSVTAERVAYEEREDFNPFDYSIPRPL
ncbi:hypothetical protein L207DRAFT_575122 [Hyaloscypha variabilis F]|uniref:Uncharacterized protein n=1 Tax=Hyaloscypha variabilis (strain UAMH 11265 / GT02V1 / F) TaxID=1149755 RepID=A0A2J6SCI7_HYAVF|nr:hypothetical protein L207DRAFT_575122 [Hyaloscypha variabilis F]